jgi:GxxExxY protein
MKNQEDYNQLTSEIIACCIDVHRELGPGLLESVYEECLEFVLQERNLKTERQKEIQIHFKGRKLDKTFKLDLLIEDLIVLELKTVESILPVHEAQLVSYLKLSNKKLGLLVNFNSHLLKDGIRRRVNNF